MLNVKLRALHEGRKEKTKKNVFNVKNIEHNLLMNKRGR